MYDDAQQLAGASEFCAGVLSDGKNFMLFPFGAAAGPFDTEKLDEATEQGFVYCGTLGMVNGHPGAVCENATPLATRAMMIAAIRFGEMVAAWKQQKTNESAVWLEQLYQLPDTRPSS